MANKLSKKKGFTLVEILIVLAVISLVILLGVSSYGMARKKIKLDLATNSLESTIIEARNKTRSGYYDESDSEIADATSICFGFIITEGGFIKPLMTDYNRLSPKGSQCDKNSAKELLLTDQDKDIVVKDMFFYGNETGEEVQVFFAPPDANIEIEKPLITQDKPELKVVIGYEDSDDDLNKRQVVFNVLTGSTYSQTFINDEN
jgi:prepilin-type N-terminal cleavage/methylation domain-containing protein